MKSHDTHRGFITIGWRPSKGCQHDTQQQGQDNYSGGKHSIRANFDALYSWQHIRKPPIYVDRCNKSLPGNTFANCIIRLFYCLAASLYIPMHVTSASSRTSSKTRLYKSTGWI